MLTSRIVESPGFKPFLIIAHMEIATSPEPNSLGCETFLVCQKYVESLGFPEATFDVANDICHCEACSATKHAKVRRGGRTYILPFGWCGFGLAVDEADFERHDVFRTWHVAFHGTNP